MAHQSGFQQYSQAFADWQANGGPIPQIVRDFRRQQGMNRDAELRAKGYGPSNMYGGNREQQKSQEALQKQLKQEANRKVAEHAPRNARLFADVPSKCFTELSWKADPDGDGEDGMATGTFAKDGSVYSWPCDRDTFADWCSDSLGKFFNAEIR